MEEEKEKWKGKKRKWEEVTFDLHWCVSMNTGITHLREVSLEGLEKKPSDKLVCAERLLKKRSSKPPNSG